MQYYSTLVLLEQFNKAGLIESTIDGNTVIVLKKALQRKARQLLIIGYDILSHHNQILSKAWARSSMMSSMCSVPMLRRTVEGVMCCSASSSGESCEWVVV